MIRRSIVALSTVMLLLVSYGAPRGAANAPDGVAREIFRQPFAGKPGYDAVIVTVDYPPGAATPPHEHPAFTYAYVLEGAVVSQLDDQKPRTYTKGQVWSEVPNQHHMVSRNASATEPAKLLVFFIIPHDARLLVPLPQVR